MGGMSTYTALLEGPDDEGWIVVTFPALRGCVTQGRTRDEAIANAHEALELYLEALAHQGEPIPVERVNVEVLEIAV